MSPLSLFLSWLFFWVILVERNKSSKQYALEIGWVQLALGGLISLILLLTNDPFIAISAFAGACISGLPSLYFAWRLYSNEKPSPSNFVAQAYVGESVKLVFTIVLFVIAIVVLKLAFLPLICTYAVTIIAYFWALFRSNPS